MNVISDSAHRNDPVEWLKQDHRVIRGYLEALSGPAESDRAASFEALKHVLTMHNAIEENLVYPALAKVAGDRERAMDLYHETAEADILIYTMTRAQLGGDRETFGSCARELTDAILEHVRQEEDEAFPMLEAAPHNEREELARQIVRFKQNVRS